MAINGCVPFEKYELGYTQKILFTAQVYFFPNMVDVARALMGVVLRNFVVLLQ